VLCRMPSGPSGGDGRVRLTLPWAVLVSDNAKHGGMVGKLTERYRFGKEALSMVVMGQVKGARPRFNRVPLALNAKFYPPDRRRRDIANLCKLIFDAMQGIVYDDDRHLTDIRLLRESPSPDNPRVEIEILEVA
jgi:Holliday junction resolvase RusA-like endonuclease